ncbi:MAG: methylaspartate mutase subunit S [Defluviitaleaceae bacterium]|nr:methylaspartate mutase subunit S [Defluviitaleaceae bacterium]
MKQVTLVMGVVGADVHAVGNKILNFVFTEAGFKVVNLGVMVTQKEFVEAAIEAAADAIIVSSLYGHGEIDCKGLRDKCDEAGLKNIKLYAGGNLVIGKVSFEEVEARYKEMGFDRVYPPGTDPKTAIEHIKQDFGM